MKPWILKPEVAALLETLYADAAATDPLVREAAKAAGIPWEKGVGGFKGMGKAYLAVPPAFGTLLYTLARGIRATTIVEFGTSFGVSTIFLAAALRDNGGGRVITTEYDAEKARCAEANLTAAGLEDLVEFRVGDALETLAEPPRDIDMIFLDGAKDMYFPIVRLLEPQLRPAGLIASDNTDHEGMEDFLSYIRTPENGYTTSAILTGESPGRAHEITIRH